MDRDDLLAMATTQADAIFKGLDADIVNLKRQVREREREKGRKESMLVQTGSHKTGYIYEDKHVALCANQNNNLNYTLSFPVFNFVPCLTN